jgi:toxin-antitoxin system PIN domain toxin
MNTLNFLDSNVWLALMWRRHSLGEKARQWYELAREEEFFVCRFTQLSVLRLLTNEQVLGDEANTMTDAWRMWDRSTTDMRAVFLSEPDALENEFRVRTRLASRSRKVWADAYLLAFAAAAGLKLVTFDRALTSRSADVLVL